MNRGAGSKPGQRSQQQEQQVMQQLHGCIKHTAVAARYACSLRGPG